MLPPEIEKSLLIKPTAVAQFLYGARLVLCAFGNSQLIAMQMQINS
jgi:hypothetical protein